MSIAIGVICIITVVTLRDEFLLYRKRREYRENCELYRAHEETFLLTGEKHNK